MESLTKQDFMIDNRLRYKPELHKKNYYETM
jgi:hypothetical protein